MAEELPINYVKYKGEKFLPITSTKAVINEDGVSVEDLLLQEGNVYEFAKDEMDKTLNLIEGVATTNEYITNKGGTGSSTSSLLTYYVSIDASKGALMLNSNGTWDEGERAICFFDTSKNFISGVNYKGLNYSFTIPNNASYFRLSYQKTLNVSVSYNGPIVHQKDINGDLLWRNGNPNSNLEQGDAYLSDSISKYRQLNLVIGDYYSRGSYIMTIIPVIGKTYVLGICISTNNYSSTRSRQMSITNDTTIYFQDAFNDGGVANGTLVVREIYGIK